MATRRMFSKVIVDSDDFLDMPVSARLLYYDLGMRADDDGFVNPKRVMRISGASADDLKILLTKDYVLNFENKVLVIRDWKINNFIRPDRYTPTIYKKYLEKLQILETKQYTTTSGIPTDIPAVSIGKDRLGKVSIDKDSIGKRTKQFKKPSLDEIKEYIQSKQYNVNAKTFYDYFTESGWVDSKGQKVKNWKQKIITWDSHNKETKGEQINEEKKTKAEVLVKKTILKMKERRENH